MFETYFFLFIDSLFASLILPIQGELAFNAMIIFGNHNLYLIYLTALFASLVGLTINFFIGKLLTKVKKTDFFKDSQDKLSKIEFIWNKYLIWLIPIISLSPIINIFCLFCGFFNSKLRYFIPLVILGKVLYYLYMYYISTV